MKEPLFIDGDWLMIIGERHERKGICFDLPMDAPFMVACRYTATLLVEDHSGNPLTRCAMEVSLLGDVSWHAEEVVEPEWSLPWGISGRLVKDSKGCEWFLESGPKYRKLTDDETACFDALSQPGKRPLSPKELKTKRRNGENRAVLDPMTCERVLALYNNTSGSSASARAAAVARRCADVGRKRKDGKPISARNVADLVRRRSRV